MTYQKTELKRAKARVGQPDGRASRGQGAEARVVVDAVGVVGDRVASVRLRGGATTELVSVAT